MSVAGAVERFGLSRPTPAQWYLLIGGWFMFVHAVLDVAFYEQSTAIGAEAVVDSHMFLGAFQLNLWHSVAEFTSAISFLVLACLPRWSTLGAFVNGVVYALLFASFYVFGSGNVLAEVMVENEATNLVHLVLALGAFVAFWLTTRRPGTQPAHAQGS